MLKNKHKITLLQHRIKIIAVYANWNFVAEFSRLIFPWKSSHTNATILIQNVTKNYSLKET